MLITLHFREVRKNVVTRGKPFLINIDHIEVVIPALQYETKHSDIFTSSDPIEPYLVFESFDEVKTMISGIVGYPIK
nr:MAG TPA: Flagellar and Swarming motility protein [Caudoviricetes sp.]